MPCACCCETCQEPEHVCCGGDFTRLVGVCCEDVWRTEAGVCCDGVWEVGAGTCCGDIWQTGTGVCCDGVWYTTEGECCGGTWHAGTGRCCAGVWHSDSDPDTPCEEGYTFLQWGQDDACCGCLPPELFDPELNGGLETPEEVAAALCCPVCDGEVVLKEDGECPVLCCENGTCTHKLPSECTGYSDVLRCCDYGCEKACCTELSNGAVQCETDVAESLCDGVSADDCDGCLGECCIDGVSDGQKTKEDCDAAGGLWAGLGSTACQGEGDCRAPFTAACCESKQSSGAGLIFIQPYSKRTPPFSGTLKATVTGTTDSPILVHGIPVGAIGKRCPFQVSFVLCRDRFEIEPVPCGTNFHRVDVEVCWEEQTTTTEKLNFSACNGLSVALSDCTKSCVTTLEYKGPGATTNAAITLHGHAIIAANGTGALILSTAIAHGGSCNRTLTLSGNNTANNAITAAIGDPTGGTTAVTKAGPGVWVLSGASSFSGNLLVKQGTLVGGVNSVGTTGAFGSGSVVEMFIGDTSPASSGTATLLMDPGVNTTKIISVLSSAGPQQVRIGGRGAGSVDYQGSLWLDRNVTLVAGPGSTTAFSDFFYGPGGPPGTPTTDVTFGAAGFTGTVQIFRDLETSGDIYVRYGTAEIMATGSIEAQSVTVDAGATLVIRGLASNPGGLVDSATLTNNTLTVAFLGNPASNDQYVLLTGETINDYATVSLTGTSATGTYDSVTSTLTID